MKTILTESNFHLLRFDKNEDVIIELIKYCSENKITSALINAIGSTSEVVLSYYNLQSKQFEDHNILEDLEIINLSGNVSLLLSQSFVHVHGVFAKKNLSTIGGHVKKLIISATCEVTLQQLNGNLVRINDTETGLNILQ